MSFQVFRVLLVSQRKGPRGCSKEGGEGLGAMQEILANENMLQVLRKDSGPPALLGSARDNTAHALKPAKNCSWTTVNGGSHYD